MRSNHPLIYWHRLAVALLVGGLLGLALVATGGAVAGGQDPATGDEGSSPDAELISRLRATIERLTAPDFAGRRAGLPPQRAVAYWLAERLQEIGLSPWGDRKEWFQVFVLKGDRHGRNVIGGLRGRDPGYRDEIILIGAHYDHLGIFEGKPMPGANDNAAGVAVMMEAARILVSSGQKPRRSVAFVGLDASELELAGARALVNKRGTELRVSRLIYSIMLETLGRDMVSTWSDRLLAVGVDSSMGARGVLRQKASRSGLKLREVPSFLIEGRGVRGDYGVLRDRKVPYVMLTAGVTRHFHRPTDVPDSLQFDRLAKTTRLLVALIRGIDDMVIAPDFVAETSPSLQEAELVLELSEAVLAAREELSLSEGSVEAVGWRVENLRRILHDGELSETQRLYIRDGLEALIYLITRR